MVEGKTTHNAEAAVAPYIGLWLKVRDAEIKDVHGFDDSMLVQAEWGGATLGLEFSISTRQVLSTLDRGDILDADCRINKVTPYWVGCSPCELVAYRMGT